MMTENALKLADILTENRAPFIFLIRIVPLFSIEALYYHLSIFF
jgi:hypothetical protein